MVNYKSESFFQGKSVIQYRVSLKNCKLFIEFVGAEFAGRCSYLNIKL